MVDRLFLSVRILACCGLYSTASRMHDHQLEWDVPKHQSIPLATAALAQAPLDVGLHR